MKKIKMQIEVDAWETSDGKKFQDEEAAKEHELKTEGKAITCPTCKGSKGKVEPDGYGIKDEWCDCSTCKGKGYLILAWVAPK